MQFMDVAIWFERWSKSHFEHESYCKTHESCCNKHELYWKSLNCILQMCSSNLTCVVECDYYLNAEQLRCKSCPNACESHPCAIRDFIRFSYDSNCRLNHRRFPWFRLFTHSGWSDIWQNGISIHNINMRMGLAASLAACSAIEYR